MAEIHLDFLNLNSLFIILLILLIGGYLYYEIHKLKVVVNEIKYKLNQSEHHIQPDYHEEIKRDVTDNPTTELPYPSTEDGAQPTIDEQTEWSYIHKKMEQSGGDLSESTYSDDRSEGDIQRSDYEQKEVGDKQESISPVNNSANIDEILAGKNIITDNSLSDILNVDSDLTKIDEFINTIKENELTKTITTDYDKMTVSQLKKILSDKELPVSGNKTKLIERIKESNLE